MRALRARSGLIVASMITLCSAWLWRGTLSQVSYANDAAFHEEMVRVATFLLRQGRNPLTSWYPYLSGGNPNYLHYQALPSIITGAVGLVVGSNTAFVWSTYLLLVAWPLGLYWLGRTLLFTDEQAALMSLIGSCVISVTRIGYESKSYIWVGYGLWAQEWGMWCLAVAIGAIFRGWQSPRWRFVAIVALSATFACHFETAYLGVLAVLAFGATKFRTPARSLKYVAYVLVGVTVCTAWIWVPLWAQSSWAAQNEVLRSTPLGMGYGAMRLAHWLFTGQLLDYSHLPIITVLLFGGVVLMCFRRLHTPALPYLLVFSLGSFIMGAGRTTFGPLLRVVPAINDLYLRRFTMGAGLVLIVIAALALDSFVRWFYLRVARIESLSDYLATRFLYFALATAVLIPSILGIITLSDANQTSITEQLKSQVAGQRYLRPIMQFVNAHPGGRVFAGSFQDWGRQLTVGHVPLYQYLATLDAQEIGYQLRTAALLGPAEWHLDPQSKSDYEAFGVRFVITGTPGSGEGVGTVVMRSGPYTLREIKSSDIFALGHVTSLIRTNRLFIGVATLPYLRSNRFAQGQFEAIDFSGYLPQVVYGGQRGRGSIQKVSNHLTEGVASATVDIAQPTYLYLSASWDPGWSATVDGEKVAIVALSPGGMGVEVPAGRHTVVFVYKGFPDYLLLFATSILGAVVLALHARRRHSFDLRQ